MYVKIVGQSEKLEFYSYTKMKLNGFYLVFSKLTMQLTFPFLELYKNLLSMSLFFIGRINIMILPCVLLILTIAKNKTYHKQGIFVKHAMTHDEPQMNS